MPIRQEHWMPPRLRDALKLFLAMLVGVVLTVGALSLRHLAQGLSEWGAQVTLSDSGVRNAIQSAGVELPAESWDLYYAVSGFQDLEQWIAFTVRKEVYWSTIQKLTGRRQGDFSKQLIADERPPSPNEEKQGDTLRSWRVDEIQEPLYLNDSTNHSSGRTWILDQGTGRIYLYRWTT